MAILEIQTGENNPILRKKSVPVKKFDGKLKKLVKDLRGTMLKKDGLGLASPQCGVNERIIIVTLGYKTKEARIVAMINPEILSFGDGFEVAEEGCISLPGIFEDVERPREIAVKYQAIDGEEVRLNLSGLDARVAQHEIDHLDGVLFIDKVKKDGEEEGLLL